MAAQPEVPHPMEPNRGGRTDHEELKEILKEMLHRLDYAYNYRLQKLVFYGDVWCIQNFGKRLTDASFKPYNYGSYSDDVTAALDELVGEQDIEFERVMKSNGPTRKYLNHLDGGELSPAKKEIIKQVLDETAGISTEELAQFSKQTWLFKNTEEGEPMDFEFYGENVVLAASDVTDLDDRNDEPLDVDDFESLIPT